MHNQKPILVSIIFLLSINYCFAQKSRTIRKSGQNFISQNVIVETIENDSLVAKLGYNIQDALLESDIDKYLSLFDNNSFKKLIFQNTNDSSKNKEYKTGFLKGIEQGMTSIPQRIISEIEADSYYDFVNYGYDYENKTYYLLYRLYSAETGLNYHKYRVSKLNNKFVFNDIYIYLSGEAISKTFNRFYLYSLPKESLLEIFKKDNVTEFLKMFEAVTLHKSGDFKKAYEKFNNIEGDLAKDKFVLILKSICAANISDLEYQKSLKTITETYPNDASLYLSQIDYRLLNKEYDLALDLIHQIELETSDDFLNLLKGNVELERENYTKALEYFKYISDNYPDFFQGHANYLSVLTLSEDYEACIVFLNFLVNEGYEKGVLIEFIEELDENGDNELNPLVISKPYSEWKD